MLNKICLTLLLVFLFIPEVSAKIDESKDKIGLFSGRVSKINKEISMIQVRVDFSNFRYLKKKDKLVFWEEHNSNRTCEGYVVARSPNYFLLKVANFATCMKYFNVSPGGHLLFYSQDLVKNIEIGRELVAILIKKRIALYGMMSHSKKDVESYSSKVEVVNKRYQLLREKLELEWKKEIGALEEDQTISLRKHKEIELRVSEIDQKMEAYKIEEDNMRQDRWALDFRLYR